MECGGVGAVPGQAKVSLRAKEIVFLPKLELRDLQPGIFQPELRVHRFDGRPKKDERVSGDCELTSEFLFAGVHAAVHLDFAGEIGGAQTEESGEIAEVFDRRGNVPAENRLDPIRRTFRQCEFAAQGELVVSLLQIKLLDLHFSIVERGTDHHRVRSTIAPGQPAHLSPQSGRGVAQVGHFAAKGEFARVKRTARPIRPFERVRHLGEGNLRAVSGNVPNSRVAAIVA